MSLASAGNPGWNTIRGVRFTMLDGWISVPVLVTHAALDYIEVARNLVAFNKNRDAIERIASSKHDRGDCEETGAVIVQARDFKIASL